MKKKQTQIGTISEEGAICINKKGPVELCNTSSGEYIVYFHIGEDVFLYNKRDFPEEAQQLFDAVARMAKKR
jgi:hypothetical protein